MAVENKYVDANIVAGKKTTAAFNDGAKTVSMVQVFEIAAADSDESVYRVFKGVNPDLIPKSITIYNDDLGDMVLDVGLFESIVDGVGGDVIDQDVLADGLAGGTAATRAAPKDGLASVAIENANKTLWQLAGHSQETKKRGYDITIKIDALTTNDGGTVVVIAEFIQG